MKRYIKLIKRLISSRKYQPYRWLLISVFLSLILAGLFQDDISSWYTKFKYRNEPLTINVLTLIRDDSEEYWNLTNWNFKQEPLMLEILGRNYSTDDPVTHLIIQNVYRINISEDEVNLERNYCLFSFPIQLKAKRFSTLQIGQAFDFEGMNCSKCIENTVGIKHFGKKPINNFFARLCVEGIIKKVRGDYLREDGLHCIEIRKSRFNFGEDVFGKFSVIDYEGKSTEVHFRAVSDEQGEISDYNFVHTGALLKSNCEANNIVTRNCWGSWLYEKLHNCT